MWIDECAGTALAQDYALVGQLGEVVSERSSSDTSLQKRVRLSGELWAAELANPEQAWPEAGRMVEVVAVEGLSLVVEPATPPGCCLTRRCS